MASSLQRLVFLLCACLMLQEFAPVYTAHISHHALKKRPDKEEEGGSKRGVLWTAIKYITKNAIKGVTFSANVITFSANIEGAVYGCNKSEPEIPRLFTEVEAMRAEYYKIKDEIQATSWEACKLQTRSEAAFESYKFTRELFKYLDDEHTKVLQTISADTKEILVGFEHNLTQFFENLNASGEAVDAAQVETRFGSDLEIGMNIAFTGIQVATPVVKKLWKKYLKNTHVGKKISQLATRFKTKFVTASAPAKNAMKKVLSAGVLGKAKEFISKKLQSIVGKAGGKFTKAVNFMKKAKAGVKGLAKLGGAALAVWMAWDSLTRCRSNLQAARDSKVAMQQELEKIKGFKVEMDNGYAQVKEAWADMWGTTTDEYLLGLLEETKAMVLDPDFLKAEDEKQELAQRVDRYLEVAKMDSTEENTQIEMNRAQEQLNQKLNLVKVTLGCYRKKVGMFNNVVRQCSRGDSPFLWIYEDTKLSVLMDEEENCQYRTGEKYISAENMQNGWNSWVERNDSDINAICLMNDELKVRDVTEALRGNKNPSAAVIVKEILAADKQPQGEPEVEEMIKQILEENPNLPNDLPDAVKNMACPALQGGTPPETVLNFLKFQYPDLTLDQIKNLDCDAWAKKKNGA